MPWSGWVMKKMMHGCDIQEALNKTATERGGTSGLGHLAAVLIDLTEAVARALPWASPLPPFPSSGPVPNPGPLQGTLTLTKKA